MLSFVVIWSQQTLKSGSYLRLILVYVMMREVEFFGMHVEHGNGPEWRDSEQEVLSLLS